MVAPVKSALDNSERPAVVRVNDVSCVFVRFAPDRFASLRSA